MVERMKLLSLRPCALAICLTLMGLVVVPLVVHGYTLSSTTTMTMRTAIAQRKGRLSSSITRRQVDVRRQSLLWQPTAAAAVPVSHWVLHSTNRPSSSDEGSDTAAAASSPPSQAQAQAARTTFDQAGKSLMDEEDSKRMEAMGDFDANPDSTIAQMNQMREAIRARTAAMGLEKSQVSADYIAQRQQQAVNLGSASAVNQQLNQDTFAGLDLSQISTTKVPSQQRWGNDDEEVPSMFYDPEDELTAEQRAEIDPMLQKGILEQGLNELKSTKWPDPIAALREVVLMFIVVAATGTLIIGWDKVLRFVYTDVVHFIPSAQDLADYLQRFDGLDLPPGWTDNMNDADISAFTDTVTTTSASTPSISSSLPDVITMD